MVKPAALVVKALRPGACIASNHDGCSQEALFCVQHPATQVAQEKSGQIGHEQREPRQTGSGNANDAFSRSA